MELINFATDERLVHYPYRDCVSDLDEYDLKNIPKEVTHFFYEYYRGSYNGDGQGIGLDPEKKIVYSTSFSHCSCYGPIDGPECFVNENVESFLSRSAEVTNTIPVEIYDRIAELINV